MSIIITFPLWPFLMNRKLVMLIIGFMSYFISSFWRCITYSWILIIFCFNGSMLIFDLLYSRKKAIQRGVQILHDLEGTWFMIDFRLLCRSRNVLFWRVQLRWIRVGRWVVWCELIVMVGKRGMGLKLIWRRIHIVVTIIGS